MCGVRSEAAGLSWGPPGGLRGAGHERFGTSQSPLGRSRISSATSPGRGFAGVCASARLGVLSSPQDQQTHGSPCSVGLKVVLNLSPGKLPISGRDLQSTAAATRCSGSPTASSCQPRFSGLGGVLGPGTDAASPQPVPAAARGRGALPVPVPAASTSPTSPWHPSVSARLLITPGSSHGAV